MFGYKVFKHNTKQQQGVLPVLSTFCIKGPSVHAQCHHTSFSLFPCQQLTCLSLEREELSLQALAWLLWKSGLLGLPGESSLGRLLSDVPHRTDIHTARLQDQQAQETSEVFVRHVLCQARTTEILEAEEREREAILEAAAPLMKRVYVGGGCVCGGVFSTLCASE